MIILAWIYVFLTGLGMLIVFMKTDFTDRNSEQELMIQIVLGCGNLALFGRILGWW